jgi:hypothetical protein
MTQGKVRENKEYLKTSNPNALTAQAIDAATEDALE